MGCGRVVVIVVVVVVVTESVLAPQRGRVRPAASAARPATAAAAQRNVQKAGKYWNLRRYRLTHNGHCKFFLAGSFAGTIGSVSNRIR